MASEKPKLTDLPTELLDLIATHVKSLKTLSLINKQMRGYCFSNLFSSFRISSCFLEKGRGRLKKQRVRARLKELLEHQHVLDEIRYVFFPLHLLNWDEHIITFRVLIVGLCIVHCTFTTKLVPLPGTG